MSRLHFKDLLRITKGTPQKLFVVKRAARDGQQWWEKTFTKAIAAQPASFTTQQINAKDYYCFNIKLLNAAHHSNILAAVMSQLTSCSLNCTSAGRVS
jgi:hypothetical protein